MSCMLLWQLFEYQQCCITMYCLFSINKLIARAWPGFCYGRTKMGLGTEGLSGFQGQSHDRGLERTHKKPEIPVENKTEIIAERTEIIHCSRILTLHSARLEKLPKKLEKKHKKNHPLMHRNTAVQLGQIDFGVTVSQYMGSGNIHPLPSSGYCAHGYTTVLLSNFVRLQTQSPVKGDKHMHSSQRRVRHLHHYVY